VHGWLPIRCVSSRHRTARRGLDRIAVVCAALLLAAAAIHAEPEQTTGRSPAAASAKAASTLEATRPVLADSIKRQTEDPNLDNERRLGFAYLDVGVLDAAFDHFQAALRRDPRDVSSNEAMARIWRDWHFPATALTYAYRAVYWAPESARTQNTLGTVLLSLGFVSAAHDRFDTARGLDPEAGYPLNNLCYASMSAGRFDEATAWCRAALDAEPTAVQSRNNLALSLALAGDVGLALAVLAHDTRPATAAYNQAVLLLATRQTAEARDALVRARLADPSFLPALKLLRQVAARRPGH